MSFVIALRKLVYSWILNSGFSVFIRHTLLLCATLFAQDLRADGGVARLKQSQGPITVTVFTPPAIYANAPTDVSILVQRSDSAELLLDAAVTLRIIPAKGSSFPLPRILRAWIQQRNHRGDARASGVEIHVCRARRFSGGGRLGAASTGSLAWEGDQHRVPLSVLSPESRLTGLVPYLALPIVAIALFLANQWLRRPRLDQPVARMPEQSPDNTGTVTPLRKPNSRTVEWFYRNASADINGRIVGHARDWLIQPRPTQPLVCEK